MEFVRGMKFAPVGDGVLDVPCPARTTAQPKQTHPSTDRHAPVGATIGRPPKNAVFRIFRRKITVLFALRPYEYASAGDADPHKRFSAIGNMGISPLVRVDFSFKY